MAKEKVYCSECQHLITNLFKPACLKTQIVTIANNFYERAKTINIPIEPSIKNRRNDCDLYEQRKL